MNARVLSGYKLLSGRTGLLVWALCSLFVSITFVTGCDRGEPIEIDTPSDWEVQYPQPQSNTLYSIDFVDEQIAVAVGAGGVIIRSTDGGSSWSALRSSNRYPQLHAVSVTPDLGFAVGESGTVLRTLDGGASWHGVAGFDSGDFLSAVDVVNSSVAVIVGLNGLIRRTEDAGRSWLDQDVGPSAFTDLSFYDSQHGVVTGLFGPIQWTSDGGRSWQNRDLSLDRLIAGVAMTSDSTAVVVTGAEFYESPDSEAAVFVTTDFGQTWSMSFQLDDMRFTTLTMADSLVGYAATSMRRVFATVDGGVSWREAAPIPFGIASLAVLGDSPLVGAGLYGTLIHSVDGADTWELQSRDLSPATRFPRLTAVTFVTPELGWIGSRSGGIFRTVDGGETWSHPTNEGMILDLHFFNDFIGLATRWDNANELMHTNDHGETWDRVITSANILWFDFTDSRVGLGTGPSDGAVLKTSNGGRSWDEPVTSPAATSLVRPFMLSDQVALILGKDGHIYRTENGGAAWTSTFASPGMALNAADFSADRTVGLVVGAINYSVNGTILRSTDKGKTWQDHSIASHALNSVRFASPAIAYAVGDSGDVLVSTDRGVTWTVQDVATVNDLNDVYFTRDGQGVAVGEGGTILRTR